MPNDPFGARTDRPDAPAIYRLDRLAEAGVAEVSHLPRTVKILLENLLRQVGGAHVTEEDVTALARWPESPPPGRRCRSRRPGSAPRLHRRAGGGRPGGHARGDGAGRAPTRPGRPAGAVRPGDRPLGAGRRFGSDGAYARNIDREYERNGERYQLLRWAQGAFAQLPGRAAGHGDRPPGQPRAPGPGGHRAAGRRGPIEIPDTLVGTDSHTTMINGLGVLGWGVGGIEAEAAMLGEPLVMGLPVVIGVRFGGSLRTGVTATDLVLTLTEMLRRTAWSARFVEFCGDGLSALSLPDRATLSNMSPEFGATAASSRSTTSPSATSGHRPRRRLVPRSTPTPRSRGSSDRDGDETPVFSDLLELDLDTVEPSMAGPRRPQDRVPLGQAPKSFADAFGGNGRVPAHARAQRRPRAARRLGGHRRDHLVHQHLEPVGDDRRRPARQERRGARPALAALGQDEPRPGLARGHRLPRARRPLPYLDAAGLPARRLRLHDLHRQLRAAAGPGGGGASTKGELAVASVLSGNRNFEGRIHPQVRASYLASPPLVVAYALAGHDRRRPDERAARHRARRRAGLPARHLAQPRRGARDRSSAPSCRAVRHRVRPHLGGRRALAGARRPTGALFDWDADSTYVREPPFFERPGPEPAPLHGHRATPASW